ncbi:MAG: YfhO family protein [Lachnospiraceae bacterium]|nr:YfhO family protein [Lachnospiraceae bacterium]
MLREKILNNKKWILYLLAFLIPVVVIKTILVVLGIEHPITAGNHELIWLILQGMGSLSMYIAISIISQCTDQSSADVMHLLCAVAYSLSSYSLLQTAGIGSHIAVILFPMLYAAFERAYRTGRIYIFILFAVAGLVSEPVYGACALLLCLTVFLWRAIYQKKKFDQNNIKALGSIIAAFLLVAPFWLAEVWQALFVDHSMVWDNPRVYQDWLTLISRFFLIADESVYITVDHGTNLYCGFFCLFLCFVYLLQKEVPIKKRIETGMLFGLLLLLVNAQPVYDIFTFFSHKSDVAVCLSYIPAFFLLMHTALIDRKQIYSFSYKRLFFAYTVLLITFVIISRFAKGYHNSNSVFLMLVLMTGYMLLLFFYRKKSIKEYSYVIVLAVLICAELVIDSTMIMKNVGLSPDDFAELAGRTTEQTDNNDQAAEQSGKDAVESVDVSEEVFRDKIYPAPADMTVVSRLEGLNVIRYDNGIIGLDSHKAPEAFTDYILSYKFQAEKTGVLYISHGSEAERYGEVKEGDDISYKAMHAVNRGAVEYELFQACYLSGAEELSLIEKKREAGEQQDEMREKGFLKARILGIVISVIMFVLLLIGRRRKVPMTDRLSNYLTHKRERKTLSYAFLSFLLPFGILLLSCIMAGLKPFGSNSFWHGDGIALTMPSMYQARDHIMRGSFTYSFTVGGGFNLFYFNPALCLFSWLCFIPRKILDVVICYVMLAKISLGGTGLYVYLTKSIRKKKSKRMGELDPLILAFTTAYALCSYQLCMTSYFYWSDIVFLLPLILLSMEKLLERKEAGLYCGLLAAAMILNCYNAIYICFFLILWFFTFSFNGFKDFLVKGFRFAICSLMSVGMSFWVIYATVLSRRYGVYADADSSFPPFSLFQSFWKSARQFFLMADPVSGTNENGMANFYCGLFAMLLIVYGVLAGCRLYRFAYRLVMLLFVTVSTNISSLDYVWNGFHYQNNMPGRYAFLIVFLMLDIAWDVVQEISEMQIRKGTVLLAGILLLPLTILAAYFGEARIDSATYTLLILIGYAVCAICFLVKKKNNEDTVQIRQAVIFLMIFEVAVNCIFVFRGYAESVDLLSYSKAAELINEKDPDISGMDRVAFLGADVSNQGETVGVGSLGIFNSFLTPQQSAFAGSLGMAVTNNMIRDSHNLTLMSNALGRVKYIFVNRYIPASGIDLNSYKVIGNEGGVIILENENIVPEGFWLPDDGMKDLDNAEVREEFYNILSGIYTGGKRVFDHAMPMKRVESVEGLVDNEDEAAFYPGDEMYENFREAVFHLVVPKAGRYYDGGYGYTYLGNFKEGEKADFERIVMQPDIGTLLHFDEEAFHEFVTEIKTHRLQDLLVEDGWISGRAYAPDEGYVCVSVPNEPGWKVFVDGMPEDIHEMNNGLMAVKVEQGRHEIRFEFIPVGVYGGVLVSLLSWMLFFGYVYDNKTMTKNKKGMAEKE